MTERHYFQALPLRPLAGHSTWHGVGPEEKATLERAAFSFHCGFVGVLIKTIHTPLAEARRDRRLRLVQSVWLSDVGPQSTTVII